MTDKDEEIRNIILPMMLEEGIIVPHDTRGYALSPAFMRVLDVSGAGELSHHSYYTFEQIETAVDQFCHDCGYDRRGMILGGVLLMLNGEYPDRMRRVLSWMKRMAEDAPIGYAESELYMMMLRQEGAKRRMK